MELFLKHFTEYIEQNNLFSPGDGILAGVSGGLDSVVLLHLLNNLQKNWGIDICIAHVNYGLRGDDSNEDERFVKKVADQMGYKFFCKKAKLKTEGHNLQLEARNTRMEYFSQIISENGLDCVVLAQHRDDNVETVLLHLIRGAGLQGLKGIGASTVNKNLKIVRPMLSFWKNEIKEYAVSNGIKWREDVTNVKSIYTRNHIRLNLMPLLREMNPRVDEAISNLSKSAAEDDDALVELAQEFAKNNFVIETGRISFSREAYLSIPKALRIRILFIAYETIRKNRERLAADHIEHMDHTAQRETAGKSYDLPEGILWRVEDQNLSMRIA